MTPEIYRRAGEVFDQLQELPENEREAAIETACGGQPELRAQVIRLIEADRAAGHGFLEGRAVEDAARLLTVEAPALPAAGTVIGGYRLGARTGAGGMGVVYEGRDLRLDRRVAIKILPLGFAGESEERIRRFQREARAASTLNHPNIISIFDADVAQGYHFIAMEFVEGKTLRQLIRESPRLDGQTILDWIGQTASALGAAHEAGIVHRDIKPENIMIRPDGFVKVLDFGLAKLFDRTSDEGNGPDFRTRPGNLAGTLPYLSPEQVLGEPAGPRSDLFSLGVVAYELATGVLPFQGATDGAVFNAILHHSPAPPSSLRPGLEADLDGLIQRSLEKDPELRFQTAGDLRSSCRRITRDYIARALEGERSAGQPSASPPTLPPPLPPAQRRRRWPLAAVIVLALAVGAALVWMTRPVPAPRVTRIVKITNDGLTKQRFVNDGSRLYYAAGARDTHMRMFQVSLKGGEPLLMPRLTGMLPLAISPDRSEMLLGQILQGAVNVGTVDGPFPIWVADTLGNAPRRWGGIVAQEISWSPKGDEILYSNGPELRIARGDGSQSRLVTKAKGLVAYPVWSPGADSIRFTLMTSQSEQLWQVNADGTHLHEVFPDWRDHQPEAGVWTAGGKYFVLTAGVAGTRDLWTIPTERRFLETSAPSAVRLTPGPMKAYLPQASPDGHRIFFQGQLSSAELVRYDSKLDSWATYLGGLPATQVEFSQDGKWIVYARPPERSIWRRSASGSDGLQLSDPALTCLNPRWSPDGKLITFTGARIGESSRLYVVPAAGGEVRQLTSGADGSKSDNDGNWSPDGATLVFGAQFGDPSVEDRKRLALETVDLQTGRIARLPGTEGLWSPRRSPDQRYIAAMGLPNRLWLYEVETGKRTLLTKIGAGWPCWSRDSQYVYFQDTPGTDWYRVSIKDARAERVMSLAGLKMDSNGLGWVGLTPDGATIATRDAGGTEIYGLDWEWQ